MMTRAAADQALGIGHPDRPVTKVADAVTYLLGAETLLASWEQYARGATGAVLHRFSGVAAAVFPNEPERDVYNNALLARCLADGERAEALEAMEAVYAAAGVERFAAWVHESDKAMRSDLQRRGYTLDEVTRAMGMTLNDIRVPPARARARTGRLVRAPAARRDARRLPQRRRSRRIHTLLARLGGENVATAIAFDFDSDCGIYNVGTLKPARRRGLGTRSPRTGRSAIPRGGRKHRGDGRHARSSRRRSRSWSAMG